MTQGRSVRDMCLGTLTTGVPLPQFGYTDLVDYSPVSGRVLDLPRGLGRVGPRDMGPEGLGRVVGEVKEETVRPTVHLNTHDLVTTGGRESTDTPTRRGTLGPAGKAVGPVLHQNLDSNDEQSFQSVPSPVRLLDEDTTTLSLLVPDRGRTPRRPTGTRDPRRQST